MTPPRKTPPEIIEARKQQAEARAVDAAEATAEAADRTVAIKANTAKLKALRLARDEADQKNASTSKPKARKKPAVSKT